MFLIGLAIFTPASLAAGLAGSGAVLIASRAVQGLGAALLVPATLAIILATFDDARERTTALGVWNAAGAMALASGPLIGGFISQHLRWGWIFVLNVPVGVVTFVIAVAAVRESRGARDGATARRLDLPGLAVSAVTLFSLTYALIEGHDRGWTSPLIAGAFALAMASLAVFVVIENRASHPMVALSMFRSRVFSGGTVTMMLWAFGVFGIYFFTAIYLQTILGFSPTRAGLAFVPMALAVALFSGLRRPGRGPRGHAPDGGGRHAADGGRPVPDYAAGPRCDVRRADAWLPDVRRRGGPDERPAGQRGSAGHAAGALGDRLRPAQRLT